MVNQYWWDKQIEKRGQKLSRTPPVLPSAVWLEVRTSDIPKSDRCNFIISDIAGNLLLLCLHIDLFEKRHSPHGLSSTNFYSATRYSSESWVTEAFISAEKIKYLEHVVQEGQLKMKQEQSQPTSWSTPGLRRIWGLAWAFPTFFRSV